MLKKLIDHPGALEEKSLNAEEEDANFICHRGASIDFFICIVQGQVEMVIGNENLVFNDGPFTVFGMQALLVEKGRAFMPDYTVKILSDVQYLKINRALYRSAIRATQLERSERAPSDYEEFDEVFSLPQKEMPAIVNDVANDVTDETGLLLVPIEQHQPKNDNSNVKFETPI